MHGWGHEEQPFSLGWRSLPQEHLAQELLEVPPNPAPRVFPNGCFGGDGVERRDSSPVGSAGPPQGHASSLRAEVAMVMDLPTQATLGPRHPLHTGGGHSNGPALPGHLRTMPSPSRWRWPWQWSRDSPAHGDCPHGKPLVEGDPQICLCTVISLPPRVDRARSLYRSFPCSKMGVITGNYLPHKELINVCALL